MIPFDVTITEKEAALRRKAWRDWARSTNDYPLARPDEETARLRYKYGRHPNDARHELRCNLPSGRGSCLCLYPFPAPVIVDTSKVLSVDCDTLAAIGIGEWIRHAGPPATLSYTERVLGGRSILMAGFLGLWPAPPLRKSV